MYKYIYIYIYELICIYIYIHLLKYIYPLDNLLPNYGNSRCPMEKSTTVLMVIFHSYVNLPEGNHSISMYR